MKKSFGKWRIPGAAVFLLAGCLGNAAFGAAMPSEETLKTDACQVVADMLEGNFEAVTEKFDAVMTESLTAKQLEEGFVAAVSALGEHIGTVSVEGVSQDVYYVVSVLEEFEKNGLQVNVVYDSEGLIAGMRTTYAPLPPKQEETEESEGEAAYREVTVTVAGDPALPLEGTLTLPEGKEKPPVVILVQGSGSSDRDENYNGNRPFADLARGLAKQGIATLRYDKRHFVYPENAAELGASLTLREETLDDVNAAIELMREEAQVDGSRIYVLGHSLGGALIPAVAAKNPDLAGVISMAGTLRPLWELSYDQNQEVIQTLKNQDLPEEQQELLETQIAQIEADTKVLREELDDQNPETLLLGIPAGYWQSVKEYCGMNFIDQVKQPMLILQGDADFQVYPETDYQLWKDTVGNRDNVVFHLYAGLNHLMMPTQGKRDITEYAAAGHVDPQVIDDVAAFVQGEIS